MEKRNNMLLIIGLIIVILIFNITDEKEINEIPNIQKENNLLSFSSSPLFTFIERGETITKTAQEYCQSSVDWSRNNNYVCVTDCKPVTKSLIDCVKNNAPTYNKVLDIGNYVHFRDYSTPCGQDSGTDMVLYNCFISNTGRTCTDECSQYGNRKCKDLTTVQYCRMQDDGCLDWVDENYCSENWQSVQTIYSSECREDGNNAYCYVLDKFCQSDIICKNELGAEWSCKDNQCVQDEIYYCGKIGKDKKTNDIGEGCDIICENDGLWTRYWHRETDGQWWKGNVIKDGTSLCNKIDKTCIDLGGEWRGGEKECPIDITNSASDKNLHTGFHCCKDEVEEETEEEEVTCIASDGTSRPVEFYETIKDGKCKTATWALAVIIFFGFLIMMKVIGKKQ